MPRPPRTTALTFLICLALTAIFSLLSYAAALRKSATLDEPLHAAGALAARFYSDHRIDAENPPLWKYWMMLAVRRAALRLDESDPAWLDAANPGNAQIWATRLLYQTSTNDGAAFINAARGMMLLLGAATMLLTAWWAHRLAGAVAAIAASFLFAFDPTFLAHAAIVKNDVAIALLMLALVIALWHAGRRMTVASALAIAFICAAAVNVKFSGLLLPVIAVVTLVGRAVLPHPWPLFRHALASRGRRHCIPAGMSLLIAIVCFAGTWATYGFRYNPSAGALQRIDTDAIVSEIAHRQLSVRLGRDPTPAEVAAWRAPLAVRIVHALDRRRMLPNAWNAGFLGVYRAMALHQNYLLGNVKVGGWWYYFPLAVIVKTPLATLAAGGLATLILLSRRLRFGEDLRWALLCCTIAAAIYLMSAMTQPINHGVRHLLPLYPLAFILIAVTAAHALAARPKPAAIVAVALAAALVVESVAAFPNYIAFFNAAASRDRLHLLSDSNLDWGQDLPLLAQWREQHPKEKLYLCYYGAADPAFYGITDYINLPGGFLLGPPPEMATEPGVVALSATRLQGLYMSDELRAVYARFRNQRPREVLGGTIYLFDYQP